MWSFANKPRFSFSEQEFSRCGRGSPWPSRCYRCPVELSGKRVLLTGASGGLGVRLAAALAGAGASVTVSGRDRRRLEELVENLPGEGHQVAVADLGMPGGAEGLVREVGAVDCLVANAGLPATGRITDLSGDEVAKMLRVNLEAPIHLLA